MMLYFYLVSDFYVLNEAIAPHTQKKERSNNVILFIVS